MTYADILSSVVDCTENAIAAVARHAGAQP